MTEESKRKSNTRVSSYFQSTDNPIRLAILGAGKIGKIQAQVFHRLGIRLCAVLCSSDKTAKKAAKNIENTLGVLVQPFSKLDKLFQIASPDAITICTPPHLHFEHTIAAFDRALPVFCEKPLFWNSTITRKGVETRLNCLASHPHRQLFVNTSNAYLIDAVRHRLPAADSIYFFNIQFHTLGHYRGNEIALDLLPHGLSMLITLLGQKEITQFQSRFTQTTYQCSFNYGDCLVKFNFQEQVHGDKKLLFVVNDQNFLRIQKGADATFRVFLKDCELGANIEIQNPLQNYIMRFTDYCQASINSRNGDAFAEASANMRLIASILL